jgi:hypothetical protein
MIDDQIIKRATEEILSEINLSERRYEIEPALGAPHADARQIRLFDADGSDKAVVVNFQDKDGNVSADYEAIKEKIRKQLETLIEINR